MREEVRSDAAAENLSLLAVLGGAFLEAVKHEDENDIIALGNMILDEAPGGGSCHMLFEVDGVHRGNGIVPAYIATEAALRDFTIQAGIPFVTQIRKMDAGLP